MQKFQKLKRKKISNCILLDWNNIRIEYSMKQPWYANFRCTYWQVGATYTLHFMYFPQNLHHKVQTKFTKNYDQCSVQGLKSKFLQFTDTSSIEFNTILPDICGTKRSHQEEWLLCFMGGTHWEPFSLLNHQITLISDLCSIMTSYIFMALDSWTLLVYLKVLIFQYSMTVNSSFSIALNCSNSFSCCHLNFHYIL